MNPISSSRHDDQQMLSLLDRLVCHELDEPSRDALLNWLEADPQRWRRCGLAFLEAQTWSHALSTNAALDHKPGAADQKTQTACRPPRMQRLIYAASLAICMLIAFGLGFAASRGSFLARLNTSPEVLRMEKASHGLATNGSRRTDPLLASVEVQPPIGSGAKALLQIPVAPVKYEQERPTEIPNYVRSQWERRGYRLSLERRYVFGNLPDGEQIAVPVQRLHANYVGLKVY